MSGEMKYVWGAYALTWLGMALYVFAILRRAARAEDDLGAR